MSAAVFALDPALVEPDASRGTAGDPGVVRDDDEGLAALAPELLEQADDVVARPLVEVAGGLVRKDDAGGAHQRARDRDALLLPAAQLRGDVPCPVGEVDAGERLLRAAAALARGRVPGDESSLHVLLRRQRGNEVEPLEDEAERVAPELREVALPHPRQVAAVEVELAARRPVHGAQHLQERRLAGPGGSLDGEKLALVDGQVDPAQRVDLLATLGVALGHVCQFVEHGQSFLNPPCGARPRDGAWRRASRRRRRRSERPPEPGRPRCRPAAGSPAR